MKLCIFTEYMDWALNSKKNYKNCCLTFGWWLGNSELWLTLVKSCGDHPQKKPDSPLRRALIIPEGRALGPIFKRYSSLACYLKPLNKDMTQIRKWIRCLYVATTLGHSKKEPVLIMAQRGKFLGSPGWIVLTHLGEFLWLVLVNSVSLLDELFWLTLVSFCDTPCWISVMNLGEFM